MDDNRHGHNRPGSVHGRLGHDGRGRWSLRPADHRHRQRGPDLHHHARRQGRRQHAAERLDGGCTDGGCNRRRHGSHHGIGGRPHLADRIGRLLDPRHTRPNRHECAVLLRLGFDDRRRRARTDPGRCDRHGRQLASVRDPHGHRRQQRPLAGARRPGPVPARHRRPHGDVRSGHGAGGLPARRCRERHMGHDRNRHERAVLGLARHDDSDGRPLRLPRRCDRRHRQYGHESGASEHPRRQRRALGLVDCSRLRRDGRRKRGAPRDLRVRCRLRRGLGALRDARDRRRLVQHRLDRNDESLRRYVGYHRSQQRQLRPAAGDHRQRGQQLPRLDRHRHRERDRAGGPPRRPGRLRERHRDADRDRDRFRRDGRHLQRQPGGRKHVADARHGHDGAIQLRGRHDIAHRRPVRLPRRRHGFVR